MTCPECRDTGTVTLFTSTEPCLRCTVKRPHDPAQRERRATLHALHGVYPEDVPGSSAYWGDSYVFAIGDRWLTRDEYARERSCP